MKKKIFKIIALFAFLLTSGQIIGLGGLKVYLMYKELEQTKANFKIYQKLLENYHLLAQRKIAENLTLQQKTLEQESLIQSFAGELEGLKQNVNTLVKLRNLDEELLKKYSKVYFLNENYIPRPLMPIDPQYVNNSEEQYILANVMPFLYALLDNARKEGIDLKIRWGYRSFWDQKDIKSSAKMTFGSGANKFIADQGYSEHQLGTTVDFTTSEFNGNASLFHKTKAYKWLLENAYKYGFVLSYPENNKYYIFEPWHWRFVGIKLATKLHNENKYFYELDQKEIDEYLIYIFDW